MDVRRDSRARGLIAALVVVSLAACGDGGGGAEGAAPKTDAPALVDVAEAAGVVAVIRSGGPEQRFIPEVKSLGVAIFDYDGDDRPDVLLTGGSTLERIAKGEPGYGCVLYRNVTEKGGPMRFLDATAEAKVPSTSWANGPCVGDFDADGVLDVLVTGFREARLWRGLKGGTFEDATERLGVAIAGWSTGAAWADLDLDGDLDLYVARYLEFDANDPPVHGARFTCVWKGRPVLCGPRGLPAETDVVLRNDGPAGFVDVTAAWGFDAVPPQYGLGVLVEDLDGDGAPEIFVANDSGPCFLWRRRGDRFIEDGFASGVAYAEDGSETAAMGVDAADVDGDGLPDLVVTNFEAQPNTLFCASKSGMRLESSRRFGLAAPTLPDLAWGCGFEDFDLDGDLDLFFSNGHVYPEAAEPSTSDAGYAQNCRLMLRDGPRFVDAAGLVRLDAAKRVGRGAAFGDLDLDGDVDVVVVNLNDRATVFENRATSGRPFLRVRLVSDGPNREAIGARVRVETSEGSIERTTRRNRSFQASSEARLVFGLGAAARAERVVVRWPDGVVETFGPFEARTSVDLRRGSGRR
jgi:enediyne biosynthesis protein E4